MQLKYFAFFILISCVFAGGQLCCRTNTTPVHQVFPLQNELNETERTEHRLANKTANQTNDGFSKLPKEKFFCIVSFLNPKDVIKSLQLSKSIKTKLIQAYKYSMITADRATAPITPINILLLARNFPEFKDSFVEIFKGNRSALRCQQLYPGSRNDLQRKIQSTKMGIKQAKYLLYEANMKCCPVVHTIGKVLCGCGGVCFLFALGTPVVSLGLLAIGGIFIVAGGVFFGIGRAVEEIEWKFMSLDEKTPLLKLKRELEVYNALNKYWEN